MYCQSTTRNQRWFNVKHAFHFTLTLVVCVWFLYQIKHSNSKKYVERLRTKFSERQSIMVLGRKGDVELSDKDMYMSDSNNANFEADVKQKDRGDGDDELDGNVNEKGGNESLDKGIKYGYGDVKINVEEGKTMEPQMLYNLSTKNEKIEIEMRDIDNEVFSQDDSHGGKEKSKRNEKDQRKPIISDERQRNSADLVEQRDEKGLGRHKEPQKDEEISTDALKRGKDGEASSSIENGDDKDLRNKVITKQLNISENATVLALNETANAIHGFHDENGFLQGGNDLVDFTLAMSRDDEANNILDQESISSFDHSSRITTKPQTEGAAYKSKRNPTDGETKSQGKNKGSKSDMLDREPILKPNIKFRNSTAKIE